MLCIFCGHNNHVSHNCDFYVTKEERWEILRLRNCCRYCLTANNGEADRTEQNSERCEKCKSKQRCYICFTFGHHTVYCPTVLTHKLFLPNLDQTILSRFVEILTAEERHLLFLSFPIICNIIKWKPLKRILKNESNLLTIKNNSKFNFLILMPNLCLKKDFRTANINVAQNVVSSRLQFAMFRIFYLEITLSLLKSSDFLQLLSSTTWILKCKKVEFYPKLRFRKILQKAPNLEDIDIQQTNVETWPEDLLQLNPIENLNRISIHINDFNFNVESIAAIFKKKCITMSLYIRIPKDEPFDRQKAEEIVTEKLSPYFVPADAFNLWKTLRIIFGDVFSCSYNLK